MRLCLWFTHKGLGEFVGGFVGFLVSFIVLSVGFETCSVRRTSGLKCYAEIQGPDVFQSSETRVVMCRDFGMRCCAAVAVAGMVRERRGLGSFVFLRIAGLPLASGYAPLVPERCPSR